MSLNHSKIASIFFIIACVGILLLSLIDNLKFDAHLNESLDRVESIKGQNQILIDSLSQMSKSVRAFKRQLKFYANYMDRSLFEIRKEDSLMQTEMKILRFYINQSLEKLDSVQNRAREPPNIKNLR